MPTLQFKGKSVIETYHHTVPHHRLEFVPKLSLLAKGSKPSLDDNLIIEGDNLLALKALLPTHAGKVKCVYIDPPYNTGEESWVYNDNLTQPQFKDWIGKVVGKEGDDATRHDKWCCMMYPRLRLLWDLLRGDGVLFASIDENEAGSLRMMLDEIFRTSRPLATFVWKRRSPTGMRGDPVSVDHEYVLAYAKDQERVSLSGVLMTEADYPFIDEVGKYRSTDLTIGMTKEDRPNQFYVIRNPRTGTPYEASPDRVWRFEPSEMSRVIENELVIWPDEAKDSRMTRPRFKTRFDPENPQIKPVSSWIEGRRKSADDGDDEDDVQSVSSGLNAEGGRILSRIFGEKVFNYPKPPSLIRALVKIATTGDEIVLDSYAGSGTTGQSVLEANADDGHHRRFVLVQMPYDNEEQKRDRFNLCERVVRRRVEAVASGYSFNSNGKTQRVSGLGGTFSYLRIGAPLFSEYHDFGSEPPSFVDLAKYVFYTETSREIDLKKINQKTGLIGQLPVGGGTSYYLLYAPQLEESREMSTTTLRALLKSDKNRNWVIYCEKIWIHPDELRKFESENDRRVRPMLVPFQLK